MAYLDTLNSPLTASQAAHLLRRATFGPTKQEINDFTGLTASQAITRLISNVSYTISPPAIVDLSTSQPTAGKQFLTMPLNRARANQYHLYLKYWWIGLMANQNGNPSILEKLTAFWQNHFVVTQSAVHDYRLINKYLKLLRDSCLGNFRSLAIDMTKDAGMLIFQNGNENEKSKPNENYARELQELFIVGAKNFAGKANYTEDDVKAAARVLTGWQVKNYWVEGSGSFEVTYNPDRHDTTDKTFSSYYGNKTITGQSGDTSGDTELGQLIDMMLSHQEAPKFICRKLYRWFVNTNVTQEIETNVIMPLAAIFTSNGFNIEPVIRKLLSSQIFYDQRNIGALIKSPVDHVVGTLRFFSQPVPSITSDYVAFSKYTKYVQDQLFSQQYIVMDQPTVFGYIPYYQTGYTENWVNGSIIGRRNSFSYTLVYPSVQISSNYTIGVDLLAWVTNLQPNFADVAGTPAVTCEQILASFTENLFAVELSQSDKNFLIDTIMMGNISRQSWLNEWNAYRRTPTDANKKTAVVYRFRVLMGYLLRMAEYYIF